MKEESSISEAPVQVDGIPVYDSPDDAIRYLETPFTRPTNDEGQFEFRICLSDEGAPKIIKAFRKNKKRQRYVEYLDGDFLVMSNYPEAFERATEQPIEVVVEDIAANGDTRNEKSRSTSSVVIVKEPFQRVAITSLNIQNPFKSLLAVDSAVFDAICESMQKSGFDNAYPIIVWKGPDIVVDGNTRLQAAKKNGIKEIPVCYKEFSDEEEALNYALHCQRDRRNLSDAGLLELIRRADKIFKRGGDRRSTAARENSIGSHEPIDSASITAGLARTSATRVKKARTILKHGDEKTICAVESGEKTLNKAYKETRERRIHAEQTGNTPNARRLKVLRAPHWYHLEWNPLVRNADDDAAGYDYDEHGTTLLQKQQNKEQDSPSVNVLICPDVDIMDPKIGDMALSDVLKAAQAMASMNFIIITEHLNRLHAIEFPPNVIAGTKIRTEQQFRTAADVFAHVNARVKLAVFEAEDTPFNIPATSPFNWVVITSKQDIKPHRSKLAEGILKTAWKCGCPVYVTSGVCIQPIDYPKIQPPAPVISANEITFGEL